MDFSKSMNFLLEKEEKQNNTKILKPDFSQKAGREFLAFYLYSKFNQILNYDRHSESPIFQRVKDGFLPSFTQRLIDRPDKRILIGISGESASGKTTICNTIKQVTEQYKMPIEILSADNYFKDISGLIKKYGSFDKLLESGYDVDSPDNFCMDILYRDLKMLSEGKDVKIPEYLVNGTGVVIPEAIEKQSKKIIVVEGMATMYGEVANLFDIKLYVDIDPEIHKILNERTDRTWPTTWFAPRLTGEGAFKDVYSVMNNWGANHGAISYGHIGADLITLASMLRIPVCMHNVDPNKIFRPSAWNAFGMDPEGSDYRACQNYGALYK